jgi:hypothetical protein
MPGVKGVIGVTGVMGFVEEAADEVPGPSWRAAEFGERSEALSNLFSGRPGVLGRPSCETTRIESGWRELLVA